VSQIIDTLRSIRSNDIEHALRMILPDSALKFARDLALSERTDDITVDEGHLGNIT